MFIPILNNICMHKSITLIKLQLCLWDHTNGRVLKQTVVCEFLKLIYLLIVCRTVSQNFCKLNADKISLETYYLLRQLMKHVCLLRTFE